MYQLIRPIIFSLPPETSHKLAVWTLKNNLILSQEQFNPESLRATLWNKIFPNIIGMAAGFDKHAECYPALYKQGFGFVEVGGVTLKPQPGNPKPRVFRLKQDQAIINRMGLNSHGVDYCLQNFQKLGKPGLLGINIAPNKESNNWIEDYCQLVTACYPYVDYISVNISSPNTVGLRSMQSEQFFERLVSQLHKTREALLPAAGSTLPILVKIAPDLTQEECTYIADASMRLSVDGLIIGNTTTSRGHLTSKFQNEQGGLSGKPLFELSTAILKQLYQQTSGSIPLIGVGGISSAEDAYTKIKAGASLLQLYSACIYHGFSLITKIKKQLPLLLEKDGFTHVKEAVGSDYKN